MRYITHKCGAFMISVLSSNRLYIYVSCISCLWLFDSSLSDVHIMYVEPNGNYVRLINNSHAVSYCLY